MEEFKCPNCGNLREISAHQVLRVDVIVDGHGDFVRNAEPTLEQSIYDAGTLYGPFTCMRCKHIFDKE